MRQEEISKLADVFVRMGGNVQKGDVVVVTANLTDAPFVREVTRRAYDCGAKEVVYRWIDQDCERARFLCADPAVFDEYPSWMVEFFAYYDAKQTVYLYVDSDDPDLMSGVEADRLRRNTISRSRAQSVHRNNTMSNHVRWSIAGFPSDKWAAKVFPGLPSDEAEAKLWNAILKASRADGDNPVDDWRRHNENFKTRENYLNKKSFTSLKYSNALGTDLIIELPKGHIWMGGREIDKQGRYFNPNIPTEEIFTLPRRTGVNGRAVSTMPLSYNGNLIEGFEFTFKNGRVTDYRAKKNAAVLKGLLENDEGARYLGEVSLVPFDSPINRQGILYSNTLFDENASCHLALGKAYPTNLAGSEAMTTEELLDAGVNDSLIHVDFMIGSEDLNIIGVEPDGTETPVFVDGNFAF
ncbi:MAG: aminopeptidase [Clostridiales bacterium]|jgi:aminopeptidase|nr:aminopeptidase [Clostridiales bacterium]